MGNTANTIQIQIGNRRREVIAPESWNALDLRTLLMFYKTLFTNVGDEYTLSAFTAVKLISMTRYLLRMTDADMAKWESDCMKQDEENGATIFAEEMRFVMHAALEGLFKIEEDEDGGATRYSCRLNLTKNPYPMLSHTPAPKGKSKKARKTTVFHCAADGLANISIYEMGALFTLFENYLNTQDMRWVDQLIATLYRPSKPVTKYNLETAYEGDRRQPYRKYEAKVAERAELVAGMPEDVKRVVLFWFASCRQAIAEAYPKVFKRSGDGGKQGANYGWGGLLLNIAGGPVGLEAVADQHHGNALTWLSMEEEKREEYERQAEDAKRNRRR